MSESNSAGPDGTSVQAEAQKGRPKAQKAPQPAKRELKILMLHGFTQTGPLFRAKTRALEKLLNKSLTPLSTTLTCIYPTGPIRLRPSDIPGYNTSSSPQEEEQEELDSFAWFIRDAASTKYDYFDQGMTTIATAIREAGGVDGVVGFSQGGAVAGIVASAMEKDRKLNEGEEFTWVEELRSANNGKPMGFAVVYSGFFAPVEELKWCYDPKIKTPTLHYIGSLDTVVEEKRSRALVERCEDPLEVVHPGGHFVPVSKEWVMPIVGFVRKYVEWTKEDHELKN